MKRNFVYASLIILLFGLLPAAVSAAPAAPTTVQTWDASEDFIVDTPSVTFIDDELRKLIIANDGPPENSVILTKPNSWGNPNGDPFEVGTELSDRRQWVCAPAELCHDFVGYIHDRIVVGEVTIEENTETFVVITVVDNDIDDRQVTVRIIDEDGNVLESHLLPQGMVLDAYTIKLENSGILVIDTDDSVGVVVAKISDTIPQLPIPEYSIDMACDSMSATIASGRLEAQTFVNGELFIEFDIQADAGDGIGSAWMFQPPLEGNLMITATGTLFDVVGQPIETLEWSKQLSCPIIPPPTPPTTPTPEPEPYLTHEFVCPTEATAGWFVGNGELFGIDLLPWGYSDVTFSLWHRASESEVWNVIESAGFNTTDPIDFRYDVTEYGLYSWSVMAGDFSGEGQVTCTAPTAIDDDAPEPNPETFVFYLPVVAR